jgi:hypothetical protein
MDLDNSGAVPLWSFEKDGYRIVLFSKNKFLIYKNEEEEPSYEVTALGCSCPADKYRSEMCKHRKLASFVGDGSSSKSHKVKLEDTVIQQDSMINILDLSLGGSDLFE